MSGVGRCYFCGAFVQKDDRFCWSCGRDLAAPPDAAPTPDARALEDQLDRDEWVLLRRAYLMQSRGDAEEAEQLVREVLETRPGHVPSLTLLAELQRARGDLIGAVKSAQLASESAATEGQAPPGALKKARAERAEIQEGVIRDVLGTEEETTPVAVFMGTDPAWYRCGWFLLVLAALGAGALGMTVWLVGRGHSVAYLWVGAGLLAAGWAYHDAERGCRVGLFWGPVVLFLGPFGLAIYLLTRR